MSRLPTYLPYIRILGGQCLYTPLLEGILKIEAKAKLQHMV